MASIKADDPNFDKASFVQRAQTAFVALQKANEDRKHDQAVAYMSPDLYQSWNTQIEQWKGMLPEDRLVRRAATATATATATAIVRAVHDEDFDHITVYVSGMTTVYPRDPVNGELSKTPNHASPFSEYWIFTRSAGVRTPPKSGVTETMCPYCGAPLTLNEIGQCDHCKSALRSDSFDWVVSQIDQSSK